MNTARTLAYGALGLPLAFAALPIYVHVPKLYAEHAGLALGLLGGLLLVARLLDAFSDPLLGWLADRLPKRLLIGVALLPLGAGFFLLMHPAAQHPALWLGVALVLTYLGFSAATIAYQAWGADLGSDAGSRTRLVAAREGLGLLGVLLAAALPSLLAPNLADGLAMLAWVFLALLAVGAAISLSLRAAPPAAGSAVALWPALQTALHDARLRRLLLIFVANGIAAALPATLVLFFVADVLGAEAWAGAFLALYFAAGVAGLPLWVRLAARWGRERAWLLSMAIAASAFVWAALLGPGDLLGFALVCLATGLALGADLTLPAAMAADIGERLRLPGAVFGLWNFLNKLNLALAAGLALPLLGWLGYRPGDSSADGVLALTAVYALLPLAFKAVAAALLWPRSNLTEKFA